MPTSKAKIQVSKNGVHVYSINLDENGLPKKKQTSKKMKKQTSKKMNGFREKNEIEYIVRSLKDKTSPFGNKLKEMFYNINKKIIKDARVAGGRNKHYDFEILIDYEWKKVEHKGSRKLKKITSDCNPWADSCQFYNGDPKPFSLCDKYLKLWWDVYIDSGYLISKYNLKNEKPTFEVWKKDAMRQGKPQTLFVKELRLKSIEKNGTASLFEERKKFNRDIKLKLTKKDMINLMYQIKPIYESVMKDKEYWLKINGDIHGEFELKWFVNRKIPMIIDIELIENKLDPMFKCICDDGTDFKAHLRWGYSQGITNIRLDLK